MSSIRQTRIANSSRPGLCGRSPQPSREQNKQVDRQLVYANTKATKRDRSAANKRDLPFAMVRGFMILPNI